MAALVEHAASAPRASIRLRPLTAADAPVAAAEAEARRRGLGRVHLGTRLALPGNRALFAACGFRETTRHAHPGHAAPTWVAMEKRLDAQG